MKRTLLLLTCTVFIAISCKTTHYNPETYKEPQLVAGIDGGVTGTFREYALLRNGQIYLNKGIAGEWKYRKQLRSAQTRRIFQEADRLGLDTLKFKHPGNISYYLILKDIRRSNEVKWGSSVTPVSSDIQTFYDNLMKLLKQGS